jgi:type I restriction enzyme M protein
MPDHNYFSNLIWQIADLLRGPYRPPQYERVMLPMTVLRRFDSVLAPTKARVLAEFEVRKGGRLEGDALDTHLNNAAGQRFHNHSPLDFEKLKGDPDNIEKHLVSYIKGFSKNVRDIFDFFEFEAEIERMREANILYLVVTKFCDVDLHPNAVPNEQMGLIFENLIRRFNELANETAGDHFTPREVIRLMVSILFIDDDKLLATPGTVRKLLDPACGTGGMLAEAQNYLREHHGAAKLYVYGQDYNKRAFATAASDMLMKQVDHNGAGNNVRYGDSFTEDQFAAETFDYFLTNPPFGVDWKKQQKEIQQEHDKRGFDGRFGAGLPRVNDGSLLFLQHMVDKFEPVRPAEHKHGSRLAIVFSGSPLFTGGAGSGESDIRKWIIENDWLEAIIALPEQMFYNTGIGTYVWIVTNRKDPAAQGQDPAPRRARRVDRGRQRGQQAQPRRQAPAHHRQPDRRDRQALRPADRRRDLQDLRQRRLRLHPRDRRAAPAPALSDDAGRQGPLPRRLPAAARRRAGHRQGAGPRAAARLECGVEPHRGSAARAQVALEGERAEALPQRLHAEGPEAEPVAKGGRDDGYEPDADLRDFENVPLKDDIDAYFEREVRPHVPDAWMDRAKDKVGYEINFNRHFYKYTPPRPLEVIDAELKQAEEEIMRLLREVTE